MPKQKTTSSSVDVPRVLKVCPVPYDGDEDEVVVPPQPGAVFGPRNNAEKGEDQGQHKQKYGYSQYDGLLAVTW